MLKLAIFISSLIYCVRGSGELVILQAPKSLGFSGKDVIDGHDIPEVFAASLGFTVRQGTEWPGLTIKNPFGFADMLAVVSIDGVSSLGDFGTLPVYPIDPVQDESKLWRMIQEDFLEHYPTIKNKKSLVRVDLGAGNVEIDDVVVKSLDKLNEEDAFLMQDVAELKTYIDGYKQDGVSTAKSPVVNWFVLSSLHSLSDVRGADHPATLEAMKMVRDTLVKLGQTVSDATDGRALVVAIISDGSHTRHERAAGDAVNSTAPENRATIYEDSYPAIFNIILWFSVAFIFSLIAISYFIGTMDPGRDSIIYRMTSNRMKKDS